MNTGTYRQFALERVIHGRPFDSTTREEVDAAGASRILLIGSRRLQDSATLARMVAALGSRLAGVFLDIPAHVPVSCVLQGAEAARTVNADHLVALGGGSVIDAGKVIAFCLRRDIRSPADLLVPLDFGHVDPSRRSADDAHWIRQTAVPMTLSAAEFTWFAGVTEPAAQVKHVVGHPMLVPQSVIYDPELTLAMPLKTFLASGIKAVDHAAERLASNVTHPMNDAVCVQALGMLAAALPAVKRDPSDLQARLNCLLGAWISISGGSAGVRVGASHALGHVLGAHGVPHGLTSCVMLPSVMRWNASSNAARQVAVSAALGRPGVTAAVAIEDLVRALDLPTRLREIGIVQTDLPAIAEKSLHDPGMKNNPRPVSTPADALEILQLAW